CCTPSVTPFAGRRGVARTRPDSHAREEESPMIRWLALLLASFILTGPALGADLDGTLKKIKRTNTITLGYRESSRPFSFVGDDGKPAGYSVDLCALVAASIGKELAIPTLNVKWAQG